MKKRVFSAVLILLLLCAVTPAAWADVTYPAPAPVPAGTSMDHLVATVAAGSRVAAALGTLPDGVYLETSPTAEGLNIYLRGTPTTPGAYNCVITVEDVNSLICPITVTGADSPPAADRVLDSILLESLPAKTQYLIGESLDPAGLSLRLNYTDGSSQVIGEGFALSPTLLEQPGEQEIALVYQDLVWTFTVTVQAEDTVEGIGVLTMPRKTEYEPGETLDTAGLAIRAYTAAGHRDVSEGLVCSPTELTQAGEQTITVTYGGKSCTFTVRVLEPPHPVNLTVAKLPDKISYTVGEALDPSGLVLLLVDNRNHADQILEGFQYSPVTLETAGRQEVTVRYGELSCTFNVTVNADYSKPSPTPAPTPTPTPEPSSSPAVTASPSPTRGPAPSARPAVPENAGTVRNSALMLVIALASAGALLVLTGYVFVMNRGGALALWEQIRSRFRPTDKK